MEQRGSELKLQSEQLGHQIQKQEQRWLETWDEQGK